MKQKDYEALKMKRALFAKKREGVKEVIWKIESIEKLEYLQNFFEIEPWLFEIKTRPFSNIKTIESTLLKDIHYANKRGKKTIVKRLKKSDRRFLEDYCVRYRAIKFKIRLC